MQTFLGHDFFRHLNIKTNRLNSLKYTFSHLNLYKVYFLSLNSIRYTCSPIILTPLISLTKNTNLNDNGVNLNDNDVIKYY